MEQKMTRWGVGPTFAVLSTIYGLITLTLSVRFQPFFEMGFVPYSLLATIGILLILVGIPFKIAAIIAATRAFDADKLEIKGVFGMCRHPIYAAWVVFLCRALRYW